MVEGGCAMCSSATYEKGKLGVSQHSQNFAFDAITENGSKPQALEMQRARDDQFLVPVQKNLPPSSSSSRSSRIDVPYQQQQQQKQQQQQETPRRSLIQRALSRKPQQKSSKTSKPTKKDSSKTDPHDRSLISRAICKPRRKSRSVSRSRSKSIHHQNKAPVNPKFHADMDEFIEVSATPKQLARIKDLKDVPPHEEEETPAPLGEQGMQLLRSSSLVDDDSAFAETDSHTTEHILTQCTQLCHAGSIIMPLTPQISNYQLSQNHQSAPSAPLHQSHKQRMADKVSRRVLSQGHGGGGGRRRRHSDDDDDDDNDSIEPKNNNTKEECHTRNDRSRQRTKSRRSSSPSKSVGRRSSQSVESRSHGSNNHHRHNRTSSSDHSRSKSLGRTTRSSHNRIQDLNAYLSSEEKERSSSSQQSRKNDLLLLSKERSRSSSHQSRNNDFMAEQERIRSSQSEEFVISGLHKVASDIERNRRKKHRLPPRSERPKSRAEILVAESLEKGRPGWMDNNSAADIPPEQEEERPDDFSPVNPNDIPRVLEDIARPPEYPDNNVVDEKKEDQDWLEDNVDLNSAAFEKFDTDSIFSDLKTETGTYADLDISFDATSRYSKYSRNSHYSKKSVVSGITNFTEGSASVDFHGCFG
jgi:hypothetical protein